MEKCPRCGNELEFIEFENELFCEMCNRFYPIHSGAITTKSIIGVAVILIIMLGAICLCFFLAQPVEHAGDDDSELFGEGNNVNSNYNQDYQESVEIESDSMNQKNPIPQEFCSRQEIF
ncbi:MAG: hypothetical protein JSV49_07465 [Thermoplasmata archaeon]|nr:MAG: hypothetical protein JSV49_07465 [Thermoplasmata archaeon]